MDDIKRNIVSALAVGGAVSTVAGIAMAAENSRAITAASAAVASAAIDFVEEQPLQNIAVSATGCALIGYFANTIAKKFTQSDHYLPAITGGGSAMVNLVSKAIPNMMER